MVMVLGDGQLAVEHHPVYEVRQLAHTAPDALRGLASGYGEPFLVALAPCGASHEPPQREGFAGADDDTVDVGDGKGKVDGLVLLKLHVHVAQPAADERVVAIDHHGQRLTASLGGEARLASEVAEVALQYFLFHRKTIGKGRNLAE